MGAETDRERERERERKRFTRTRGIDRARISANSVFDLHSARSSCSGGFCVSFLYLNPAVASGQHTRAQPRIICVTVRLSGTHAHTRTRARAHARTHARTKTRARAHTLTHEERVYVCEKREREKERRFCDTSNLHGPKLGVFTWGPILEKRALLQVSVAPLQNLLYLTCPTKAKLA